MTIIRKTLDGADDWKTALDLLLFHYRVRPHGVTKISSIQAMYGWEPRNILIQSDPGKSSLSAWVDGLGCRVAEIHDYLEKLSQTNWVEEAHDCPHQVGQAVLLRYTQRSQKRLAPFEAGWRISKVVAPSTVKIASGHRSKMVNVDLLKADPGAT